MKNEKEKLGLYVHIPFCMQKCRYCDFLSFPACSKQQEVYVEALNREIDGIQEKYPNAALKEYKVDTIYFGGGTPSVIDEKLIGEILCKLKTAFDISETAEITLEANPGTLNVTKLQAYRAFGINRLSIGLQSANEKELRLLGRIHSWEEFQENFYAARKEGFENINIDIMTALPGQTEESLQKTINCIMELQPEHVSAYSLIIEEGTPFYEMYHETDCLDEPTFIQPATNALPDEEKERKLYVLTRDNLEKNGYVHYEISNFAKPGYESRHNSACWELTEYLGLGLGAAGLLCHARYRNGSEMAEYIKHPEKAFIYEELDRDRQEEEFMFLGLRMKKGVDENVFYKRFGVTMRQEYGKTLCKLENQKLLKYKDGCWSLTDVGIDYGNYVFSEFLKN